MKLLTVSKFILAPVLGLVTMVGASSLAFGAGGAVNLTIGSKGNEMVFDKTQLKAKPGQAIKLTFINKATQGSGMLHNWLLVNPGKGDAVGQAGIAAGPDKGYVPASPDVLVATKLLNPGEKQTIEFKAPAQAGDYPYICSFPGHSFVMKGVLQVK